MLRSSLNGTKMMVSSSRSEHDTLRWWRLHSEGAESSDKHTQRCIQATSQGATPPKN